ncbi:hypothetical protein JCM1841_006961 [Sporobolomyces salmonicolor]
MTRSATPTPISETPAPPHRPQHYYPSPSPSSTTSASSTPNDIRLVTPPSKPTSSPPPSPLITTRDRGTNSTLSFIMLNPLSSSQRTDPNSCASTESTSSSSHGSGRFTRGSMELEPGTYTEMLSHSPSSFALFSTQTTSRSAPFPCYADPSLSTASLPPSSASCLVSANTLVESPSTRMYTFSIFSRSVTLSLQSKPKSPPARPQKGRSSARRGLAKKPFGSFSGSNEGERMRLDEAETRKRKRLRKRNGDREEVRAPASALGRVEEGDEGGQCGEENGEEAGYGDARGQESKDETASSLINSASESLSVQLTASEEL